MEPANPRQEPVNAPTNPWHYVAIYFGITNLDPLIFFTIFIVIFGMDQMVGFLNILLILAPPIIGIHTVFFIFQSHLFSKMLKSSKESESSLTEDQKEQLRSFPRKGALNILSTNIGGPILTMVLTYQNGIVKTYGEVVLFSVLGIYLAMAVSSFYYIFVEKKLYFLYRRLGLRPLSLFHNIAMPIFSLVIVASLISSAYTYSLVRSEFPPEKLSKICFTLTGFLVVLTFFSVLIVHRITSRTSGIVREIAQVLKAFAEGDLRQQEFHIILKNEIDLIANYIHESKGKLAESFRSVVINMQLLGEQSQELEILSKEASEHAESQAASLEEAASALEEYSASVEGIYGDSLEQKNLTDQTNSSIKNLFRISSQVDRTSDKARNLAGTIEQNSDQSAGSLTQAIHSIQEVATNTRQIGEILEIIKEISEQVNLLSLNASIEAARAGELGKGFAVVAAEVGKLAEKTAHSTKTISDLIKKVSNSTLVSVESVNTANANFESLSSNLQLIGKSIEEINAGNKEQISEVAVIQSQAERIVDRSNSVLTATGEQKRVNLELGTTVNRLALDTSHLSSMADKTAHASHSLNQLILELQSNLSKFILP